MIVQIVALRLQCSLQCRSPSRVDTIQGETSARELNSCALSFALKRCFFSEQALFFLYASSEAAGECDKIKLFSLPPCGSFGIVFIGLRSMTRYRPPNKKVYLFPWTCARPHKHGEGEIQFQYKRLYT
jgi:hypothetical protein